MANRALTKEERQILDRQLTAKLDEKEHCDYLIEHATLMIEKGLLQNYKQQLRTWKQQKEQIKEELNTVNFAINTIKEQIRNGVPIKEKTEGGK